MELDPKAKRVEGVKKAKEMALLVEFSQERLDKVRTEPQSS